MTSGSSWSLERFGERINWWKQDERPSGALVRAVIEWTLARQDDPYDGVRRAEGVPNLWFGGIPNTIVGGAAVACSYWIYERDHLVKCESYATLSLPL